LTRPRPRAPTPKAMRGEGAKDEKKKLGERCELGTAWGFSSQLNHRYCKVETPSCGYSEALGKDGQERGGLGKGGNFLGTPGECPRRGKRGEGRKTIKGGGGKWSKGTQELVKTSRDAQEMGARAKKTHGKES